MHAITKLLFFYMILMGIISYGQTNAYSSGSVDNPKYDFILLDQFNKSFGGHGEDCLPMDYPPLNLRITPVSALESLNNETQKFKIVNITIKISRHIGGENNELVFDKTFSELIEFNNFNFQLLFSRLPIQNNYTDVDVSIVYIKNGKNIDNRFGICKAPKTQEQAIMANGPSNYVKVPVFFATDRNQNITNDLNTIFGNKRSKLNYGLCEVTIPDDHRIGELERPQWWRLEFSEDPEKHIVIQDINILENKDFFKRLSLRVKNSSKKSSFLFVHGFNVSFADAARRTAQMSYDLLYDGAAVFYSWPSQGSFLDYDSDEDNIAWAEKNIRAFLKDYLENSQAEEIYLIAHSMGNRGLTGAILTLLSQRPELKNKIKEIILAAPDIDADTFKEDIAPRMVSQFQKPITLYVSSDDFALKVSKEENSDYYRAGDSNDGVIIVDGLETIDASGVDTSFFKHSYFAETRSVLSDIYDIVTEGKRPTFRNRLITVKTPEGNYWRIKPSY